MGNNYVPSGWKRDLLHIMGSHYAYQIGPLDSWEWEGYSQEFLKTMQAQKEMDWLDIKEVRPLKYMGYVADVFQEVSGHYLDNLSGYTGWMRAGGYYHWKVKQLKQLRHCPHLRGKPVPQGPLV